jgi:hypothetical protein
MDNNKTYVTSDLYLTAYLKLKGFKFNLIKEEKKIKFHFENSEQLINYVNEYFSENGVCEPLVYANTIKNLKNLIYNQ